MKHLFVLAALAPACASAPAAPPVLAHAQPPVIVEPASYVEGDAPEQPYASQDGYYPPYALLFHEGQKWRFPVTLAMSSTGRPHQEQQVVACQVENIEYMCDRRISNIKCDDGNQAIGGSYTANMNGMWRAGFANATNELDENTRAFERMPAPNMHTIKFGNGWCSSDGGTMLCVEDGKGLVGVQVQTPSGGTMVLGSVPQ